MTFCVANAQEDGGKRLRNKRNNPRVKTRIGISPVIGLYSVNKNHASGARQKMAFNVSVKEEIRLNRHNTTFLLIGAEYMMHGLNYNSYYFYEDSLKLYNGRMNARYGIVIHEADFPVQLKYSFSKETNSIVSGYMFAGYCYRWVVASNMKVAQDGNEMINKPANLKFKLPAFNPYCSSFLNAGFGVQRNTHLTHNAVFAELQFRYSLSPLYINESFAPSSMYMNGHFIMLTVGFKL